MKMRLLIGAVAAASAATALLLGGALRAEAPSAAPTAVAAARVASEFGVGSSDQLVRDFQAAVARNPKDLRSRTLLGLAYQQQARTTADPVFYTRAEAELRRVLADEPRDLLALTGLGSLALTRHDFRAALVHGRRALAISPTTARTYGLIGDALLELGRYDEAFRAFDRMAALRPSSSAYARISYARELLGDRAGAVEAMTLALDAATGDRAAIAWVHLQLAGLASADVPTQRRHLEAALDASPGSAATLDALADLEFNSGNRDLGIELQTQAVAIAPDPHFVEALGDMYFRVGRRDLAAQQYARYRQLEQRFGEHGGRIELEASLFYADHGSRLREALQLARQAQKARPSVDGDDALAWALARNSRCGEALGYSKRALRLGAVDARKLFHRGMIERCLGHDADARQWLRKALATDPNFSILWAPRVRELLARPPAAFQAPVRS